MFLNRSVGQPLAADAEQGIDGALLVVDFERSAIVEAETEFVHVAM